MNGFSREHLKGLLSGAVLGGLLWAGLEELGFWGALKSELFLGTLLISMIAGAIAGVVPPLWRALQIGAAIIVVAIVVVCFTPLARALVRPLVRDENASQEKVDAIVVLSGGATADSAMSSQTLDRLLRGAEAVRARGAQALVLSRENAPDRGRWVSDSADEAKVVALLGITEPVFFIDSAVSTHDEALRVRRLPAAAGWKRVGLVTSPLHSRRACATFEHAGFEVSCIPAMSRDRAIRNLDTPGDRLRAFQGWLYEFAGTTNYRMKGWI